MLEVIRNFIELLGQWWLKVDWPWWGVLLAFLGIFVLITSFIPLLKLSIWIVLWIIGKIFLLGWFGSIGTFEVLRGENPFRRKWIDQESKISYKKTKKSYQFLKPYFANLPKFNFFVWWINNKFVYEINYNASWLKIFSNQTFIHNMLAKKCQTNPNNPTGHFFKQYVFTLPNPPLNFKIPNNKKIPKSYNHDYDDLGYENAYEKIN